MHRSRFRGHTSPFTIHFSYFNVPGAKCTVRSLYATIYVLFDSLRFTEPKYKLHRSLLTVLISMSSLRNSKWGVHSSQFTSHIWQAADHRSWVQVSGWYIFYASNKTFNNDSQRRRSKFQPFPNPNLSHRETSIEQKHSDPVYKPFPQRAVTVRNL